MKLHKLWYVVYILKLSHGASFPSSWDEIGSYHWRHHLYLPASVGKSECVSVLMRRGEMNQCNWDHRWLISSFHSPWFLFWMCTTAPPEAPLSHRHTTLIYCTRLCLLWMIRCVRFWGHDGNSRVQCIMGMALRTVSSLADAMLWEMQWVSAG